MESLTNYFWLAAIFVNGINAFVMWRRAQPHIQQNPDLRTGYIRLIQSFILGISIPWFIMGAGLMSGYVTKLKDYMYLHTLNPFVMGWWISWWAVILLFSYWIWFQGGAETLIKYPDLFRGNPSSPRTIKLMCFISLAGSVAATIIMASLDKR
jgi:hypothetical protein